MTEREYFKNHIGGIALSLEEFNREYLDGKLDIDRAIRELSQYDYRGRYYHNWSHIDRMMRQLLSLNEHFPEKILYPMLIGVIFHDVSYHPSNEYNEWNSALVFLDCLRSEVEHKYLSYWNSNGSSSFPLTTPVDIIVRTILDTKFVKPFINQDLGGELTNYEKIIEKILQADYNTLLVNRKMYFKAQDLIQKEIILGFGENYSTYINGRERFLSDIISEYEGNPFFYTKDLVKEDLLLIREIQKAL